MSYSVTQQPLVYQRVSFVLRLRQSFPEDCVRLKLSSTRASQAGLKEMMMQTKSEGCSDEQSGEEETTCTTRTESSILYEETIQPAPGYKAFRG